MSIPWELLKGDLCTRATRPQGRTGGLFWGDREQEPRNGAKGKQQGVKWAMYAMPPICVQKEKKSVHFYVHKRTLKAQKKLVRGYTEHPGTCVGGILLLCTVLDLLIWGSIHVCIS